MQNGQRQSSWRININEIVTVNIHGVVLAHRLHEDLEIILGKPFLDTEEKVTEVKKKNLNFRERAENFQDWN
jgi:hypothetical protein